MAEPQEESSVEVREREIRDPRVLRAVAHPVRLRILEELALVGSATATQLAERVGESAANCSWHLRQLARYGFIEEAGGGAGRQRPWRVVVQSNRVPEPEPGEEGSEFARASDAFTEVLLEREAAVFRAWLASRHEAPREWRDASFSCQSWDYLTAGELAEVKRELLEVLERHCRVHAERFDPARRPPGARAVRFVAWATPFGEPAEPSDPE